MWRKIFFIGCSVLTLKHKYKIFTLTKLWGHFDPKDQLNAD